MLCLIAALSDNNIIGINGKLPWHLPRDLKHFKKLTLEHTVIMGRKTFDSIGKRPLPNRENIILTRQKNYTADNCKVFSSLTEALREPSTKPIFIIGGESLYKEALPIADRLYLTRVHATVEGDTFFPEINMDTWKNIDEISFDPDENNSIGMTFLTYERLPD